MKSVHDVIYFLRDEGGRGNSLFVRFKIIITAEELYAEEYSRKVFEFTILCLIYLNSFYLGLTNRLSANFIQIRVFNMVYELFI